MPLIRSRLLTSWGTPTHSPWFGAMCCTPVYVRGQAYLLLHQGSVAAAEFQKFLDHRGVVVNCPLGALARLGLARAYAMQGDAAKAKAAYQDFLALWKDADPDIAILKEAKAEYTRSCSSSSWNCAWKPCQCLVSRWFWRWGRSSVG